MYLFCTIFTLHLNTTYKISFIYQKNIVSEDIFLSVSPHSLTICDHDMPWTSDSEWKITPCHGHSHWFWNFMTYGQHYKMSKICLQFFQLSSKEQYIHLIKQMLVNMYRIQGFKSGKLNEVHQSIVLDWMIKNWIHQIQLQAYN